MWLNMDQYSWISLDMLENAWVYVLTKLGLWIYLLFLHVWQVFEDVWSSEYARVLNMIRLWICNGHINFETCLKLAPFGLIMPEYGSIYLNVPQYVWTWLNIAKCHWVLTMSKKLLWLCNVSQYAYASSS